jgi:glycosyltransferase involved in cell wall biosynthesis
MRIIALVPIKNEAWILPTYISSMKKIADEIIVLDDNSTDNSLEILKEENVTVIQSKNSNQVNMSEKRRKLLNEGRKRGGTHFIWLDADESFDNNFLKHGRDIITKLLPGQKLSLPWITLWKSTEQERVDSVWKENNKDVIVFDIPEYTFENKNLSEGRTQGPNTNIINLTREVGVVLHFQFIAYEDAEAKQAWYRCIELLQSKVSVRRINQTYSVCTDNVHVKIQKTNPNWFENIKFYNSKPDKKDWYIKEIIKMFHQYGILKFEPLSIWNISELEKLFIKEKGRKPKPKIYPKWLVLLNRAKNKLKK